VALGDLTLSGLNVDGAEERKERATSRVGLTTSPNMASLSLPSNKGLGGLALSPYLPERPLLTRPVPIVALNSVACHVSHTLGTRTLLGGDMSIEYLHPGARGWPPYERCKPSRL
jgi:hypothetical protein